MHFKPDRRNGGYVKFSTPILSHIIEEKVLLQAVKEDIKSLIKDTVKLDGLYGMAEKKANSLQSSLEKELKQVDKHLIRK